MSILPSHDLHSSKGSTLIEVLIAIAIVVLAIVSMMSVATLSVKNQRFSVDQQKASSYVQQTLEWLYTMRNVLGWYDFYDALAADGNPITYCLSQTTLPETAAAFLALSAGSCGSTMITGTSFQRSVVVTLDSATKATFVVTVSWLDGTQTHQTSSTLVLQREQ